MRSQNTPGATSTVVPGAGTSAKGNCSGAAAEGLGWARAAVGSFMEALATAKRPSGGAERLQESNLW